MSKNIPEKNPDVIVRGNVVFKRGTQIRYVPGHEGGDEDGFVMSTIDDNHVYCRFWHKGMNELRTKENSELVHIANLVAVDTRPEQVVLLAISGMEESLSEV